jgi:hypothetical protein
MSVKQHTEGHLQRCRRFTLITASAAVMTLAALAGGSAAHAATSGATRTVPASSHVAVAASRNAVPAYITGLVTFENSAGVIYGEASCTEGNSGSMSPPSYAENGCGTRVWLYEYTSHTGYTLCLDPYSNTGYLHRSYKSFWVSFNSADC